MKYITRLPALFIAILFSTTITAATAPTTAVATAPPPPPCPPQSASLPDPASTAAAINAATQALQATNITSQLAITSSKEVMEKNKTYDEGLAATNKSYYEDMTTKLLWAAGVLSLFVTAGGLGALEITNRWRIRRLARKAVTNFKTLFDRHMEESRKFRIETDANLKGFLLLTPTLSQLTNWCINYGHLEVSQRPNGKTIIERSLETCKQVLALNPTDPYLLGLVYSVKGVALSLDNKLLPAYDACKASLDHHPNQSAPLYNMACIAARLTRYADARQHLIAAIGLEPALTEQAVKDADLKQLLSHPEVRKSIGLPPIQ